MIRNLLYTICFHLVLFSIIYFSYVNIFNEPSELKHRYQEFTRENDFDIKSISPRVIKEVKANIGKRRKTRNYRDLSIKEKLDLYKKVQAKENKILAKDIDTTLSEVPENIFYYIESPVYISRDKLSEKEFNLIKKNNEIKKAIRDEIKFRKKEYLFAENRDRNNYANDMRIKIAQKPVVIKNERTSKKIIINSVEEIDFDKISALLFDTKDDDTISMKFSDEEIANIKPNEIFTKKDLDKLIGGYNLNNQLKKYDLTAHEKANIQKQINDCYREAIVRSDVESNIIINAFITVDRQGYIDMDKVKISDNGIYSSEGEYEKAVDNVKTALVFCNPLKNLPAKKYVMWHTMAFTFDNQHLND